MERAQSNQSLKRPPSAFTGTSYDVNIIATNKDVKAFDIKIKEEDLKVIKEKLTQSLNKEAVFLSIAFQGSDMMRRNIELIIWFNCGIMVGVEMKECYDENFELFVKF